jgi:hypothetical protein
LGVPSKEYEDVENLAKTLKNASVPISFTGHSLGGGLASAAAVVTGFPATTFNAAGLDVAHIEKPSPTPPQVEAYSVDGELLSHEQDNRQAILDYFSSYLDSVNDPELSDDNIALLAQFFLQQEERGHKILPPTYGTRHVLPAIPTPGTKDSSLNRHGIDWMIRSIEARQHALGMS